MVTDSGKRKSITKQEAIFKQLVNEAAAALVHLGAVEEGLEQVNRGMAMIYAVGLPRPLFRHLLAEICLSSKRSEDGLREVSEGLRDLEGGQPRMNHVELYRLKGELLLLQNVSVATEAESCFREAIVPVLLVFGGVANAQHPLLDQLANKVVQKYEQSSCEQLWQKRGQPHSQREQEAVQFLRNNPQMRAEFIDRVAAPIANKMFECGMIL